MTGQVQRVPVFFYGLFMDVELLRAQGCEPRDVEHAKLDGYRIAIGSRATLVCDRSRSVDGIVMHLTHDELQRLYGAADLDAYRPEPVLVTTNDGAVPALCYTLPAGPDAAANPEYAAKLRTLCGALSFPSEYIDSIR